MMTRTISTACWSRTARASSRGAVPNTSVAAGRIRSGCLTQSTNDAMPACATRPSHERFSAVILRNQGRRSSIAAIAAVPSAPIDRSIRATVSGCTRAASPGRPPVPPSAVAALPHLPAARRLLASRPRPGSRARPTDPAPSAGHAAGREHAEQVVDEPGVERPAGRQDAVPDGPEDDIGDDGRVRVVGQVAALARAAGDDAERVPAALEEGDAEPLAELAVELRLRHQRAEQRRRAGAGWRSRSWPRGTPAGRRGNSRGR